MIIVADINVEPVTNWAEVGRLFIIIAVPIGGLLIAFLVYLKGHFEGLEKDRQVKVKELNENREMYIKMVVQNTIDTQIKEIHEMIAELGKRIDKLFGLLSK